MNLRSAHRGKQRTCNVFTFNRNPLNPVGAKILAQKVWSVITPQWIGLESQWKHQWMRENAKNQLHFTKMYLYVWNLRKIHICDVAVLNFSKFSYKMLKHVTRIPPSVSIRFLRFADRRNTRKQDPFEKSWFGPFWGENMGIQKCRLEKLTSRSALFRRGSAEHVVGFRECSTFFRGNDFLHQYVNASLWNFLDQRAAFRLHIVRQDVECRCGKINVGS